MSNEIRVSSGLNVKKGNLDAKSSNPTSFLTDMSVAGGPSPGMVTVTTGGTDIDLSELTQPGWCRITNLSEVASNYIEVGIYDGAAFWPLMEISPGEVAGPFKISRIYDSGGIGTGTSASSTLRIRAALSSARVNVEAFDS